MTREQAIDAIDKAFFGKLRFGDRPEAERMLDRLIAIGLVSVDHESQTKLLTYRPATMDDARLLFDWRNDELTRAMSKSSTPISWDEHVAWITARLSRQDPDLYIAEHANIPIGTFHVDGDAISYTIAPQHRSRGLCTAMLKLAHSWFGPLRAEIYRRNTASLRAAEAAGISVIILD